MEQNTVTIDALDEALIQLLGRLTQPLEFEADSTVAVYDKESLYEVIDALAEILQQRMEIKDD